MGTQRAKLIGRKYVQVSGDLGEVPSHNKGVCTHWLKISRQEIEDSLVGCQSRLLISAQVQMVTHGTVAAAFRRGLQNAINGTYDEIFSPELEKSSVESRSFSTELFYRS